MHSIMFGMSAFSFAATVFFLSVAQSDIQLGIAITTFIGGFILFGLGLVIVDLGKMRAMAEASIAPQPEATEA